MKINGSFWLLTILVVLLICSLPLVTHAQLFDGEREGLLLGIGVGYAAIASGGDIEGSATGFAASGKLGYGMSDQLSIYLSSTVPSVVPNLGFMYFTDRNSNYYLHGTLGYTSADEESLVSLSGGIGYELRDHVSLELGVGYIRHSGVKATGLDLWTGQIVTESSQSNIITIAATFNVHFY